jgi:ATP-binding cassette, subfamily B, bacterial PglK
MIRRSIVYQAIKFIPKEFRTHGFYLVLLLGLASAFDLFTIASFFPLLVVIVEPGKLESNFISKTCQELGMRDTSRLALMLTVVSLLLLLAKTLFATWVTNRKANFAYSVARHLGQKMLNNFFQMPYGLYHSVDYAREMNRISNTPLAFANNFIIPIGTILAETIVALALVIVAAIYDPRIFIFLVVTLTPLALLYRFIRARVKKSSREINEKYPELLKHTLESVHGLTEIRSFKKESFFEKRFARAFHNVSDIFARDHTIHTGTGRVSELIAGICICVLLFYTIYFNKSSADAILILSMYAAISFRIIPSINRVFSSFVQLKNHEHLLGNMNYNAIQKTVDSDIQRDAMTFTSAIELKGFSFQYHNQLIFNNASITIHKNEKVVVHGKSGSGKTTLLLLFMGFLKPAAGSFSIDGKKLTLTEIRSFRSRIGYVPQNPYMLDGSIQQNIAFGIPDNEIDLPKIKFILEALDLVPWVNSLPQKSNTIIGENGNRISGGQRQRIAIARALYHNAEILLLDEITNQLDKNTEQEVMKVFDHELFSGKTIILITHRPEIWKSFDAVYELKHGNFHHVAVSEVQ